MALTAVFEDDSSRTYRYRVARDGDFWTLQRYNGEGWEDVWTWPGGPDGPPDEDNLCYFIFRLADRPT